MNKAALILAILACLAACKHTVNDSGCIIRYDGQPYYTGSLKAGQLDTVNALFNANGLSTANLNFTNYYSDTAKDSSASPYFNQGVGATLSVNGLPVFYTSLGWYFRNGIIQPNNYNPQFAYPGSDTTGHWTLPALRSQFFKTYEASLYGRNGPRSPLLGRPGIYYHDSCLYAQLGYIDARWSDNNLPLGKNLLKVWRLTPSKPNPGIVFFRAPIPVVFVVDSTGFAWCPTAIYPGEPMPIDFLN